MSIFRKLFRRRLSGLAAQGGPSTQLYERIVSQARHPAFYTLLGVPDTPDGRFDMLMLHTVLVLRRLRQDHTVTENAAQALFDMMFNDMDENLREMGVGDLGVGKRVKGMAKALYGRLAAYGSALDAGDPAALTEAIRRNVYRHNPANAEHAAAIAAYTMGAASALDRLPVNAMMAGEVTFGDPRPAEAR